MSDESSNSIKIEDIFSSDTLKKFDSGKSSNSQNSQDGSSYTDLNGQEIVTKTIIPNQNESDSSPSFSDGDENSTKESSKIMINVPQGFYAKITPETSPNITGLFTDGLGPCACIILTNTDHSYMFLAHADVAAMNICDPEVGIPAWIKEMKNQGIEESSISLHCGIDSGIEGGDYPYKILIEDALPANGIGFNVLDRKDLELKAGSGIILRKGAAKLTHKGQIKEDDIEINNDSVYLNLSGDPISGLRSFLNEQQQLEIQNLDDIKEWRLSPLEFSEVDNNEITGGGVLLKSRFNIAKATKTNYEEIGDLPFPPICCFDGKKFKEKIDLEKQYSDTIKQYENSLVKIWEACSHLREEKRWPTMLTEFYLQKTN